MHGGPPGCPILHATLHALQSCKEELKCLKSYTWDSTASIGVIEQLPKGNHSPVLFTTGFELVKECPHMHHPTVSKFDQRGNNLEGDAAVIRLSSALSGEIRNFRGWRSLWGHE